MGITVTKRPTFTVAAQQLSTYDTPGLDGILVENEGKHSIVIQMDIVIDNMDMFDDINEWLSGKGRFTRSDYPDRYMDVEVQSGLFNQFVGSTYYQTPISFYAYDPYWYPTENVDRADYELDEWLPVTNEIVNNGTTASKPILRITRGDNGTADLTVNGTRFLYFFQGASAGDQVEIDFNLRTAKEWDTLTTPNLMIGYAYPIVDVGKNKVINKGNHKLEIRRESRYL